MYWWREHHHSRDCQAKPARERGTLCDQPPQRWAGQARHGVQLESLLDQRDHSAGSGTRQDCMQVRLVKETGRDIFH